MNKKILSVVFIIMVSGCVGTITGGDRTTRNQGCSDAGKLYGNVTSDVPDGLEASGYDEVSDNSMLSNFVNQVANKGHKAIRLDNSETRTVDEGLQPVPNGSYGNHYIKRNGSIVELVFVCEG